MKIILFCNFISKFIIFYTGVDDFNFFFWGVYIGNFTFFLSSHISDCENSKSEKCWEYSFFLTFEFGNIAIFNGSNVQSEKSLLENDNSFVCDDRNREVASNEWKHDSRQEKHTRQWDNSPIESISNNWFNCSREYEECSIK